MYTKSTRKEDTLIPAYSLRVHQCIKRLRWLYRDDAKKQLALSHVVHGSIGVVYPDYISEFRKVSSEYEKFRARQKRYNRYIKGMSDTFGVLYLVSLTFTDEVLANTSAQTRKDYARKWLNENTLDYFACIDYGEKNAREHYHAICAFGLPLESFKATKRVYYRLPSKNEWKYGFYSIRMIKSSEKDRRKTAYYAFKASDYAFKNADKDSSAKPFHKRGVTHWTAIDDTTKTEDLPF